MTRYEEGARLYLIQKRRTIDRSCIIVRTDFVAKIERQKKMNACSS
jgi:hypothetical protein